MARSSLSTIKQPELIIGMAAPIGVDLSMVESSLQDCLRSVNYKSKYIKISTQMQEFHSDIPNPGRADFFSDANYKMDYATDLCRKRSDPAFLAAVAVRAVQNIRLEIEQGRPSVPEAVAYIVSQFKRPDEIRLLRTVYGRHFILVSAYSPEDVRQARIIRQIKMRVSSQLSPTEIENLAKTLIDRDADENLDEFGQHLRDTFHMADVFVDGSDRFRAHGSIERFVQAFFGKSNISPTKHEYGMYAAKSASLRSCDLSRQVGAAIFSKDGELISQGCNEVPKAFGGTYWDTELPDFRDVNVGHDPNETLKNEILRDLFSKLFIGKYLSDKVKSIGQIPDIVEEVSRKGAVGGDRGALAGALIMDLTEFGRVVHAEMCAICDAARTGRSVRASTLFCTTFPCHNCAKHILAAGISEVIYMEPYPKSRTRELHLNEIDTTNRSLTKVPFIPFMGISPLRYRDIFEKGRRKNPAGESKTLVRDVPLPMLETVFPSYLQNEKAILASLVVDFETSAASIPPTSATPDAPAQHL